MIDLTKYFSTIGILSSIVIAFVIYSLKSHKKEFQSQQKILQLQKLVTELQTENSELKTANIKFQEKISQYETKTKRNTEGKEISHTSPRKIISKGWVRNW